MANSTGLIALALGAVALAVAVGVFMSFGTLRRRLVLLQGKAGEADILEAVARQVEDVHTLRGEIGAVVQHVNNLGQALQGALQHSSVFRYDAFEEMGGKLSFSAAFLDARGSGVVISCINGRQEARTYAKPVESGKSAYNLSPEEEEAIRLAISGKASR